MHKALLCGYLGVDRHTAAKGKFWRQPQYRGMHSSSWHCEVIHIYNPHCLVYLPSEACLLGLGTVKAATHFVTSCLVPPCAPAFDKYMSYVPRRDRQCVFSLPSPFFPWLYTYTAWCSIHSNVSHSQSGPIYAVQNKRETSNSQTPCLQSGSCITSMWPVGALVKAGGWEMVTCQTSFVSLRCILQDLKYDAKMPECKINSSQSSRSCWHQPWGGGREDGGWRQHLEPPCWMFHAPGCWKSYCSGTEQCLPAEAAWAWLPVNSPCNNQVHRSEGFLQEPAWLDQSRIFVKLFRYLCIMLQDFHSTRGIPALYFLSWWGVDCKSMPIEHDSASKPWVNISWQLSDKHTYYLKWGGEGICLTSPSESMAVQGCALGGPGSLE